MIPQTFHTLLNWIMVIGAVCIVALIGALVDKLYLNRRVQYIRLRRVEGACRKINNNKR